ncbi:MULTISPECIES: hypothetical protein [Escherichia]|nr:MULTISPECIES: hypothetical protein [Escherichia]MBY7620799.1 hypothetical protein [Escherichia marmotae]EJV7174776.1 hypothetical protein [Escherichia coli]MBA0989646.1 hypothetical protein [Escherichia coli]MBB2317862.1 hypothetical protein [Escherichia sp. 93.1518]MBB2330375.1 hypothetical protein [Escherichia sp. 93.0816]
MIIKTLKMSVQKRN